MEWKLIDTAPKDKRILGCTWHPELPHLYAPKMIVWAAYHPNSSGKTCWRDSEICGNKMERVTHWMPLPDVPDNQSGNEA